jgi:hypothetical protein
MVVQLSSPNVLEYEDANGSALSVQDVEIDDIPPISLAQVA